MVVIERAAEMADQFGVSVDEALERWCAAGGQEGGEDAGAWLSVAFMFARQARSSLPW
jgi:hypothetical protein